MLVERTLFHLRVVEVQGHPLPPAPGGLLRANETRCAGELKDSDGKIGERGPGDWSPERSATLRLWPG